MGRFEVERQNFIRAYTRLLVSSWSDDLYLQRLFASPRDVLAQEGLEVPAAAPVMGADAPEAALDTQVELWLKAEETGELVLYIPDAPLITTESLDAIDLAGVSGGEAVVCCCCPCTCCV